MAGIYQIAPLSPMAHPTIRMAGMEQVRESIQQQDQANRPEVFADPAKEAGQRTDKQRFLMETKMVHAKRAVGQNGRKAFSEQFPPPPASDEMLKRQMDNTHVARNIYQDKPVKPVPFSSQVAAAYQTLQNDSLWVEQVKLHQLYA